MKTYVRSESIDPSFLTSALDGDEWSASRPSRFIPVEVAVGTNLVWGWLVPRAGLDAVENIKILHSLESNPGLLARSFTTWGIRTSHADNVL
jgi:hypothetical protein